MNVCTFVGRLSRDPELAYSQNGKAYTKFGLAVQRTKDVADFFDFTAFNSTAEFIEKHFSKGDPIAVVAEAQLETWESDGQKRSRVSFVARNVSFVPQKSKENGNSNRQETEQPVGAGVGGDDPVPF